MNQGIAAASQSQNVNDLSKSPLAVLSVRAEMLPEEYRDFLQSEIPPTINTSLSTLIETLRRPFDPASPRNCEISELQGVTLADFENPIDDYGKYILLVELYQYPDILRSVQPSLKAVDVASIVLESSYSDLLSISQADRLLLLAAMGRGEGVESSTEDKTKIHNAVTELFKTYDPSDEIVNITGRFIRCHLANFVEVCGKNPTELNQELAGIASGLCTTFSDTIMPPTVVLDESLKTLGEYHSGKVSLKTENIPLYRLFNTVIHETLHHIEREMQLQGRCFFPETASPFFHDLVWMAAERNLEVDRGLTYDMDGLIEGQGDTMVEAFVRYRATPSEKIAHSFKEMIEKLARSEGFFY